MLLCSFSIGNSFSFILAFLRRRAFCHCCLCLSTNPAFEDNSSSHCLIFEEQIPFASPPNNPLANASNTTIILRSIFSGSCIEKYLSSHTNEPSSLPALLFIKQKSKDVFSSSLLIASLSALSASSLLSLNHADNAIKAGANQYLGVDNINSSVAFSIVSFLTTLISAA
ncbi:hypothetical protein SDC9_57566 [bioreactor metagenome]|uniref:Uncharacterized protein n=1 Tax=bioreactor metagenome TaxID=1076179 RepID=A0A644X5J8_9ZZZZ